MQIDSYKTLPIGKYLKIYEISEDESVDELDKQVKIVSILNDMAEDDVYNLPLPEFTELSRHTLFLRQPSKEDHSRIADSYKLGDFELVPTKEVNKITTAQYIDFQTFSKEWEKNLVELLSCLLVPKGMTYGNGYDIADVHKAIRDNLSVSDTLSLCAFFFILWRTSIKDSLTYSKRMSKRIRNKEKRKAKLEEIERLEDSLKSGDGLPM